MKKPLAATPQAHRGKAGGENHNIRVNLCNEDTKSPERTRNTHWRRKRRRWTRRCAPCPGCQNRCGEQDVQPCWASHAGPAAGKTPRGCLSAASAAVPHRRGKAKYASASTLCGSPWQRQVPPINTMDVCGDRTLTRRRNRSPSKTRCSCHKCNTVFVGAGDFTQTACGLTSEAVNFRCWSFAVLGCRNMTVLGTFSFKDFQMQ